MTQHTPGPWMFCTDSGGLVVETAYPGSKQFLIAQVKTRYPAGDGLHHANARLIAAAPDLLEALKEARSSLEDVDWDEFSTPAVEKLMRQCDAAIAKAEGKNS
jgi:hypothetical protein